MPKNIKPITTGFTILPKKTPNLNHNLFKGKRMSALKSVINKKIILRDPKTKYQKLLL